MTRIKLLFSFTALCTMSLALSQTCTKHLEATLSPRTFSSPNFPNPYNDDTNCTWYITTVQDSQIELKFFVVDIEPEYDTLTIHDGKDDHYPLLSTLHGKVHVPSAILSSTGQLFLRFTSDDSVSKRGFRVQYRIALAAKVNVTSVIQSCLAETTINSEVLNYDLVPRAVEFKAIFPHEGYITRFFMEIDGEKFVGKVEKKENIKQRYEDIQLQGITMGYVSSTKDLAKTFFTAIMLQPGKTVTFQLVYQQLLKRRMGRYTDTIVLTRDFMIHDLSIDIYLCARSNLTFVQVPPMEDAGGMSYIGQVRFLGRKDFFPPEVNVEKFGNIARIWYRSDGIGRKDPVFPKRTVFVVHYDVQRDDSGALSVFGGEYFATFFSPSSPNLVRRIVFVLDVSGSMAGNKIEQVKIAMKDILNGLSARDSFNVVQFESVIRKWKSTGLVSATPEAKASARRYIDSFDPEGKTNIHEALITGINLLTQDSSKSRRRALQVSPYRQFVFFLGDGKPTVGMKNPDAILKVVERVNKKGFGINAIGFGKNVDVAFLQKLTRDNHGKWRIIYDDEDSHVQIQNFLAELGVPIMTDISFKYSSSQVNFTTERNDLVLVNGGEVGVFGRLARDMTDKSINVTITGKTFKTVSNEFSFQIDRDVDRCSPLNDRQVKEFAARGYGIAKLQETLQKVLQGIDDDDNDELTEKATNISLEFDLVTPVTSLVVKRQNQTKDKKDNEGDKSGKRDEIPRQKENEPEKETKKEKYPDNLIDPLPEASKPWVFEGDPHFIVALGNNITVCFTWNGTDGEMYNLLHDPFIGITLNGLIKYGPRSSHESTQSDCNQSDQPEIDNANIENIKRKKESDKKEVCDREIESFFVQLGFVFAKEKLKIEVTPRMVKVIDELYPKHVVEEMFPASDESITVVRRNVGVFVHNITKVHSFVNVTLNNTITFVVNLKRGKNLPVDKNRPSLIDHLDMDIVGHENLSPYTGGLFGIFPKNIFQDSISKKKYQYPVARLRRPGKKNLLLYRKNRIFVDKISIIDPYSKSPTECWFTYEENAVTGRADDDFKVKRLFDIPSPFSNHSQKP